MEVTQEELDLRLCVSSGQVFRWAEVADHWVGHDGPHVYRVHVHPDRLEVQTNATREAFLSLFRLDEDVPQYIQTIKELGPELVPYIDQLPGLRVMKPNDVVEETFSFLCTPNNNLVRILKMVGALAEFGERMDGLGTHRFPEVEKIAEIKETDLRERGFGYRARTIPEIAVQVCERGGRKWLEGLRSASYEDAHGSLVEIKGIGPKLADCICLFALHHTSAVPVDTHLWQAAKRHYFSEWEGKPLTDKRYYEVGDEFRRRFGALAGWAHQYLFYDNLKNWRTYRQR